MADGASAQEQSTEVARGARIYSSTFIMNGYDWFVIGLVTPVMWRCRPRALHDLYRRCAGARHLDIGPGTGLFLDRCPWPVPEPRITLVDLNPNSLRLAADRIARLAPETLCGDAVLDLDLGERRFDSVGLGYLLHCLPGPVSRKAMVFDRVIPALAPDAVVFGATVVPPRRWWTPAALLQAFYRRVGIFDNAGDSADALERELRDRFVDVRIERHGHVVCFEARSPRSR